MFEKENKLKERLPAGFRDIFPIESEERNSIRAIIKNEFELWGYGEIKTPVVEFTKNISEGVGKNWKDKLINFLDSDGSLVSLRTDMTIPIARFTAMRLKKNQLPVRLCYFANSFRKSTGQKGEKREYNQAGLEFVGSHSYMCDAETILILAKLLKKMIPDNFVIGLGSTEMLRLLCNWINLTEQGKAVIKSSLISKNYVALGDYLERHNPLKKELFLRIIKPVKNLSILEKTINETCSEELINGFLRFKKIFSILSNTGNKEYFIANFGILRDFDYYTGIIYEVYSSNINSIIGSGGRYDKLIKKFGLDVPATGFALDIDLLHKSIKEASSIINKNILRIFLSSKNNDFLKTIEYAEDLRKEDMIVELDYEESIIKLDFLRDKKIDFLIIIDETFTKAEVTTISKEKTFVKDLKSIKDFLLNERNA
ncbi:MAG: ATP phosphoribosyltransferase regulatory subunit [Actinomycetota bacterium]|nr:ATP phosphoribosyltransferase regulatory subunit [Actinomycetota bacterium]